MPEPAASASAARMSVRAAHRRALERTGGWYCDFRNDTETFVVFAGRTFHYRGDEPGRAAVAEYARSVGVPEEQLDWPV